MLKIKYLQKTKRPFNFSLSRYGKARRADFSTISPSFELWFDNCSAERSIYHNRRKRGAWKHTSDFAPLYTETNFLTARFRNSATPVLTTRQSLFSTASQPGINSQSDRHRAILMHNPASSFTGMISMRGSSNAGITPAREICSSSTVPLHLRNSLFTSYIIIYIALF